jgi:uncharacterized protein (TIGR00290 family)
MKRRRALLAWSSGKDAAYALHLLRGRPDVVVVGLFTTMSSETQCSLLHGATAKILDAQAVAARIALNKVWLPAGWTDELYATVMANEMRRAKLQRIDLIAFGDIALESVRRNREHHLLGTGIEPCFPLWGRATAALADEMIDAGVESHVTCVDTRVLDRSFLGRRWDRELVADLPRGVDPCGENGEFHTCVTAGPMFREKLRVVAGRPFERAPFAYVNYSPR